VRDYEVQKLLELAKFLGWRNIFLSPAGFDSRDKRTNPRLKVKKGQKEKGNNTTSPFFRSKTATKEMKGEK